MRPCTFVPPRHSLSKSGRVGILETFHRRQTRSAANVPAFPCVHVRHDSTAARSSDPAIRCAMADNPRADCRIEQPTNDENPVLLPIFVYRLAMWIEARHTNFRRFMSEF